MGLCGCISGSLPSLVFTLQHLYRLSKSIESRTKRLFMYTRCFGQLPPLQREYLRRTKGLGSTEHSFLNLILLTMQFNKILKELREVDQRVSRSGRLAAHRIKFNHGQRKNFTQVIIAIVHFTYTHTRLHLSRRQTQRSHWRPGNIAISFVSWGTSLNITV